RRTLSMLALLLTASLPALADDGSCPSQEALPSRSSESDILIQQGEVATAASSIEALLNPLAGLSPEARPTSLLTCEDYCWEDFYFCTSRCTFPTGPICYPECDAKLIICLNACP
ncbi:MAG: hypothetical protein KDD47_03855, partial [Acidobacteria bacterium]|nr:hypothetical protein [Acidobacteriota bacterium]